MAPLAASAADAEAARWSGPACSDAAYGGRPAFRCTMKMEGSASITASAWANPSIQADFTFRAKTPARGASMRIADPVELQLDGRTVRSIAPGQFLLEFASEHLISFAIRVPASFLQELGQASQLAVEFADPQGERKRVTVPLSPALGTLGSRALANYQSFHPGGGKAALNKPVEIEPAIWGPLGEAADRSRFWVPQANRRDAEMVDLTWLRPGKELQMRKAWCRADGSCGEYTYVVRATTDAIVDDQPRQVLTVYNEAGKPYRRFEGVRQRGHLTDFHAVDFDPVLVRDMDHHPAGHVQVTASAKDPCCIDFGVWTFRPATADGVDQLFAGHAQKLQEARQRKEQEAREERERAGREAQASRIPLDANGEPDRGPDVVPQRAPMSFAQSLQKSLQASREQDAQQARFLARVERDARATHERSQGQESVRAGSALPGQAQAAASPRAAATAGSGGADMYFFCSFWQADGATFYSRVGRVHVPRDQYVATKSRVEAAYADYIRETRNIARSASTGLSCVSGVTEAEMAQRRADGKARIVRLNPGSRGVTETDWVPRP
jgi:hypothetical protein